MKHSSLSIRYYGHPDLRRIGAPVGEIDQKIRNISEEMVAKMVSFDHCIGFAGPQLGVLLRIFVIREETALPEGPLSFKEAEVIINPTFRAPSKEMIAMEEGCMSLPGLRLEVIRPQAIEVRYQNLKGEWIEEHLKDFRARVFMHENDHLNGILHIDRVDSKKKKEIEPFLRTLKNKYRDSNRG